MPKSKARKRRKASKTLFWGDFVTKYGSAIRDGEAEGTMPWSGVKSSWLVNLLRRAAADSDREAYRFLLWCALTKLDASPPEDLFVPSVQRRRQSYLDEVSAAEIVKTERTLIDLLQGAIDAIALGATSSSEAPKNVKLYEEIRDQADKVLRQLERRSLPSLTATDAAKPSGRVIAANASAK